MTRSRRRSVDPSGTEKNATAATSENAEPGADLSYNEARAALDLVLHQLQASDLDIEAMAGLYRRGQSYARRCETILEQVEQQVLVWDGLAEPEAPTPPLRNQ